MKTSQRLVAGALATAAIAGTLGITAASAAPSSPSSPADAEHCPGTRDGAWPGVVQGQPPFDAGDRGGVYMWHDGDGWHVRVTHNGDAEQTYSGIITTPGRIVAVDRVLNEANDGVALGPDHHRLAFSFHNYGRVDGLDFRTECAPRLDVAVRGDGQLLPTGRVNLGAAEAHPTSDPFVIQRAR